MAESLILPNSTFSANNITTTGNVVISSALYLGTTSLQVSASTGGVNANVYSSGSLVRQGYAPTYVESASAPTVAAEGDKWWSTSNSIPFRYLLGGWRKLVTAPPALYTFTTATFNTGGATGTDGPVISQARSGLTGTPTPSDWYNTYLDMTTQGFQRWTVPATGSYTITVAGAGAAYATGSSNRGIIISSTISLTSGSVVNIIVGQQSAAHGYQSMGGGGGSFVYTTANVPIIIAGGGGGRYDAGGAGGSSTDGQSGTSGGIGGGESSGGGSNGNGGSGGVNNGPYGGGGGGFYSSGTNPTNCASSNHYGRGITNENAIGGGSCANLGYGGFGGGAGTHGNSGGGGGGGGYSGGGGMGHTNGGGGGGGSYSTGSITVVGYNTGAGYVTITKI